MSEYLKSLIDELEAMIDGGEECKFHDQQISYLIDLAKKAGSDFRLLALKAEGRKTAKPKEESDRLSGDEVIAMFERGGTFVPHGTPHFVPEGWQLVPIEPTQAMCQAAQQSLYECPRYPFRVVPAYKAMLADAPEYTESTCTTPLSGTDNG